MRRVNTRFMGRGSSLKNGYISQGREILFLNCLMRELNIRNKWVHAITYNIGNLHADRAIILKLYILQINNEFLFYKIYVVINL